MAEFACQGGDCRDDLTRAGGRPPLPASIRRRRWSAAVEGEAAGLLRLGYPAAEVAAALGVSFVKVGRLALRLAGEGSGDGPAHQDGLDPDDCLAAERGRDRVLRAMELVLREGYRFEVAAQEIGSDHDQLCLDIVGLLALASFQEESPESRRARLEAAFSQAGFPAGGGGGGR